MINTRYSITNKLEIIFISCFRESRKSSLRKLTETKAPLQRDRRDAVDATSAADATLTDATAAIMMCEVLGIHIYLP